MAIKNLATGEVTHVGRVVATDQSTIYPGMGMGDTVYVAVVVKDDNSYDRVTVGVYHDGLHDRYAEVTIDAPAEAIAAYNAKVAAEREAAARAREISRLVEEAHTLGVGKRIRVVKGRKVPHGTEGSVFWIGESRFAPCGRRVGFRSDSGDVYWTSADNVEVIPICPICGGD